MGSGTFTLSGANSYSGKTVVTEGTLAVTGDGTIGTGTLSLLGGSTLDLTGSGGLANAMLTAGQTKININTGLATLSGPIADGYVFEPVGGLTKLGAGTLRLSGLAPIPGRPRWRLERSRPAATMSSPAEAPSPSRPARCSTSTASPSRSARCRAPVR